MSNLKIELNSQGISNLLKSEEMKSVLSEHARQIASRCGDGYATDVVVGKTRANASVIAQTAEAVRDNYKNNTVLKALY